MVKCCLKLHYFYASSYERMYLTFDGKDRNAIQLEKMRKNRSYLFLLD